MKYDASTWNYEEGGNVTGTAAAAIAAGDGPATADSGAHNKAALAQQNTAQAAGNSPNPKDGGKSTKSGTGGEGQGHQAFGSVAAKANVPAIAAALPPNTSYDTSLQHPRCVYQLLKKQYSRYTPEMVERITGIPKEQFLKAADTFTSIRKDGDMKKVGTIIYAVGWTQHSFGTQIIRTGAMLQLLMGNVGRAGGGVNALRGHSNIQGATDMAGVFDILPGYLKVPTPADGSFDGWMKRITPKPSKPGNWESFNYWSNTPK